MENIPENIENNVETVPIAEATVVTEGSTENTVTTKPTAETTETNAVKETTVEKKAEKTVSTKAKGKTKADLQAQIDLLQRELNNVVDNSADFNNQLTAKDTEITGLKADVEKYKAEITSLTDALNTVIEQKKSALPDNLKALAPEKANSIEMLNWLVKAESNVTEKVTYQEPIGRVLPVSNASTENNDNLSAYDKMVGAFSTLFKK